MNTLADDLDRIIEIEQKIINDLKHIRQLLINQALAEGWTLAEIEDKLKVIEANA